MRCYSKNPKAIICVSIIVSFSLVLGCSVSPTTNVTHPSLHTEQPLTRHGQFTDVAIQNSLQDTTIIQTAGPVRQSRNRVTPLALVAPPLPLNVHLPPTPVQSPERLKTPKQDHDEQWHTELGWSLLVGGNYQGAIAAYRQALRQNRDFAEAYVGLGSALRMQNQIPAAIEAYEHALELEPDNPAALVHLGSIYADGEPAHRSIPKAKQLYTRASQQGDPFAKMALQRLQTRQ